MNSTRKDYTPALGYRVLTPFLDLALKLFTRENLWRSAFVAQIAPRPAERIIDVGSGTGVLTRALKRAEPKAEICGIDPDPEVLEAAGRLAGAEALDIAYHEGFFTAEFAGAQAPFDKIVTSLVLHQVPLPGKTEIIAAAYRGLRSGGELHVCDYGQQRSAVMRLLFRLTVQMIDGTEDTGHNARGVLPELMHEAGFDPVVEERVLRTATGSISFYRARKP